MLPYLKAAASYSYNDKPSHNFVIGATVPMNVQIGSNKTGDIINNAVKLYEGMSWGAKNMTPQEVKSV